MIKTRPAKFLINILLWALFVPNLVSVGQLYAVQETLQPVPQKKVFSVVDFEETKTRIKEINTLLEIAEFSETEETAKRLAVPLTRLQEYNANLRQIVTVYQRLLTSIERRDSLKGKKENLGKTLESQQDSFIAQPPPYNLSVYDNYLSELATIKQQEQTTGTVLKSAKKVFEEAKIKFDEAGHSVRDAKEAVQNEKTKDTSLQVSWELKFAKSAEELAKAYQDLQRITVENAEIELGLAQLAKQITQRHVNWVRSRVVFDQEDLNKHLDSLEERRVLLQIRIDTLRQGQQAVEDAYLHAQDKFEAALGAEESVKERAKAFLREREAWHETYQNVLEQTEIIQLVLEQEKQFWQRRYGLLAKGVNYEELSSWEKQTSDYVKNINRNIQVKEKYQTNLQSEIAGIQKLLTDENLSPEIRVHVEKQVAALNKMAERGFEYLSLLQGTRAIGQRFLDEIDLMQKESSLGKKIKGVEGTLQDIWEIELWVVDERSVTVRKLVIALFILVLGMWLTRRFNRLVIKRILLRTRLDKSAVAAVEKVLFFSALLVFLIFSLRFVNIPLTVFTFFGGAIAIGVGIGAQNLLNNVISGFILLAERPVKINDLIEVENNFGIIEDIGIRCTCVRTPGNVHILVPNSSFLEKNIVNWTLSDHEIRAKVAFGVAYDSEPREVSRLTLKAVHENEKVLKSPEPIALFEEFGESTLKFIVYFWISLKSLHLLERRTIESDIRFRIIELFREAGIVLAYPQRDIHLKTLDPLKLKMVPSEA